LIDEAFSVHVLFVDALIWVADSSGDDDGGNGGGGGLEEDGNIFWFKDIDVLSLLGIDCAETIIVGANPAAVRTISPDKDNVMTIR
jgi:hypothetical protein